jgi:uncharacterized protein with NRDE domain
MCLIAWNWQPASSCPLLLLGNRDEFYARPTLPLHAWDDGQVLAGRDELAGGTWLGLSRKGRVAALTNFRDIGNIQKGAPSRGALVANFLQSEGSAMDYLQAVSKSSNQFNAFNLLVFDGQQLLGLESRHNKIVHMQAGIGAVSNADFFTPWPKLEKLRQGLADLKEPQLDDDDALWQLLSDSHPALDAHLPDTGIGLARERALSPAFIRTPDYGTRASTLLRFSRSGYRIEERAYDPRGLTTSRHFHGHAIVQE